jgi:ABC-2 type transport system permease protein
VNRLIYAEVFKLRTTRTSYLMALCALVIVAVASAALAGAGSFRSGDQPVPDALALAALAQTFAIVIGVLVITAEFKNGTIVAAFLIAPKRLPVLVAKLITCTVTGLVFGAVTFGVVVAITLPIFSMRGIAVNASAGHIAAMIIGGAVATALVTDLGLGFGTVVRNQAGAIVVTLAVLYAIEPLLEILPGIGNAITTYGVGGLAGAAAGTPALRSGSHLLGPVPACLMLALYAAVFIAAGAVLVRRRDVTD